MDDVETMDHRQTNPQSLQPPQLHSRPRSRWRAFLGTIFYPLVCLFAFLIHPRPSPPDIVHTTPNAPGDTADTTQPIAAETTSDTASPAFACKICGRRFGVQSNLNRHERKCAQKPVHKAAAAAAAAASAVPDSSAAAADQQGESSSAQVVPQATRKRNSTSASSAEAESMARETTNPSLRPARGRRRTQSEPQVPHDEPTEAHEQDMNASTAEGAGGFELQLVPSGTSAGTSSERSSESAGVVSVVTATTAVTTPGVDGERRPKRRRRAPSPSRWVPASLRGFSLTPCRDQAQAPLPPVRPHWDERAGYFDERDSFAGPPPPAPGEEGDEENVDPASQASSSSSDGGGSNSPAGINSALGVGLSVRQRNFEYAPYHPCGWTGRLPGPAADITNYQHVSAAGPSSGRHEGGSGGFTYEFTLSASV